MPTDPPALDRDGFRRLYEAYGGFVHRRARQLLHDEQAARDVCHEVFLRVLTCDPAWNPPSPVGWLFQTTTNLALNSLRDSQRRRRLLAELPQRGAAAPGLSVPLLLRGVPDELQEIAVLYCVDEMSQDEIAALTGLSQKTVSNRLRDLRRVLTVAWKPSRAEAT